MIDVENIVFDTVVDALREQYKDIFVSGEPVDSPAKFPAVTIVESDNSIYAKMSTSEIENAVTLMYEVNVYTNTIGYKKSEAKKIMNFICDKFKEMGFSRSLCGPVTNFQDEKIYRMLARFTAKADKDHWIYQN